MKCTICGGETRFQNGVYICENCGIKQQIETFFENIDVFICYKETDEWGRRTKDSVVAQDIYNNFQNANINTFFKRISAADLINENYEKAYRIAMDRAKVVIICANSKENFVKLLEENGFRFTNKKVIPVYSTINANQLPEQLGKLQAVNYDNIGAISDLIKNILRILGRDEEVDIENIVNEQIRKKRKCLIKTMFCILIVLILGLSYIVFGTPYVLKSKKYSYAENLMNNGQYLEAAEIFGSLGDYKNASDTTKKIFDRYDGYYNKENTVGLHLNTEDNSNVEIEITFFHNNKKLKASASAKIVDNTIDFYYRDSEKKQGEGRIELYNEQVKLMLQTENNLLPENSEFVFNLSNKSDVPLFKQITGNDLKKWLTDQVGLDYITGLGYEIENVPTNWQDGCHLYNIKNTNISLIMVPEYQSGDFYSPEELRSFSAPASVISPDLIGKKGEIVVRDEIVYVPFGNLDAFGPVWNDEFSEKVIKEDTVIGIIKKSAITEQVTLWDRYGI